MSMYAEAVKTGAAAVRRAGKKDPMALLAKMREDDPTGSFERVIAKWKHKVENDAEFNDTALLYAGRNYWTQLDRDQANRQKPTLTPEQRQAATDRRRTEAESLAQKIEGAILGNLLLSNGKRLAECTGIECVAEGGWLAAVGRKVGKRVVGAVLSERQLLAMRTG